MSAPLVIVAGAIANKPHQGGEAWVRLSWIHALRELGCDVYFLEELATRSATDNSGAACPPTGSHQRRYFDQVVNSFGLSQRSALVDEFGRSISGMATTEIQQVAYTAALVNISGHLQCPKLFSLFRRKAYIDIDPGFTQFWHAAGNAGARLAGHDAFFTIGENIGQPDCAIPTGDILWRPIRQPVVLRDWPVTPVNEPLRFTTVANWRGTYGPVEFAGRKYGLKVHEFRKFWELPHTRPSATWEIALNIHPGDDRDRLALLERGWHLSSPAEVDSPEQFREFIQHSGAEFSVAQGIYVDTNSGWISDRTIRYLASGRPALVQETGLSRNVPTGAGLLTFRTFDDAVAGARELETNYAAHAAAARRLAESHFAPAVTLQPLIDWANLN